MSYDYLLRGNLPGVDQGLDSLTNHRGNVREFLTRYQIFAGQASRDGLSGLKTFAPDC